jgi:site-specific DNA-methyltransferase (adenine-specific)
MPLSEIYNTDCLAAMREMPDNAFDLAIVDPPYGINAANLFSGEKRKSGNGAAMKSSFAKKDWDESVPNDEYFFQLFRVSKNQIIWGANYFKNMPPSMGYIVWDKNNGTTKFSDCELAYTSFSVAIRKYTYTWNGMIQGDMKNKENRIHPTQKPIALYKWLLQNYAKPGDTILDTHLGSGSSRIAAYDMGFDFVGYELDTEYFEASDRRFKNHISNLQLFQPAEMYQNEQKKLFET